MKSVSSATSSSASVGIGSSVASIQQQAIDSDLAKLTPEGPHSCPDAVYDCIAYLIYCDEHDRIAVTNVDKLKCVWLPFVVLQDGTTWKKASHEGVAVLIGRQDPEMDAEEAEKTAPIYQMSYLNILRIQLPSSRIVMRLTQFVHLQSNPHFNCCENTMRVNWVPSGDIIGDKIEKLWGPEVKMLTMMLVSSKPQIIDEHTLASTLYHLNRADSAEQKALLDFKITESQIYAIYNDFVEHCYPSFFMCFESFRSYMIKHGYTRGDDTKLAYLFNGFAANHSDFIDFHDFLIGLVSIEPNSTNSLETRTRLIYRYYDAEKKGYLDSRNLHQILKEIYPSFDEQTINSFMELLTKNLKNKNQITYESFVTLKSDFVSKLIYLCRAPKSILSQIVTTMENRKRERKKHLSNNNNNNILQAKRKKGGKGTCWSCRAQQYNYANHCITIDTGGRCVEPKIISKEWCKSGDEEEFNRSRYSLEFMFSISSIPNIFIDLVRDFYLKQDPHSMGLMAAPEDRSIFTKYLRILCTELRSVLVQEDKLLRVNASAIVIGDIQGNLRDLLQVNKLFFQSFPVVAENLIFLGNYCGDTPFGVECLLYVFALKLVSPNKVFILRGQNELRKGAEGLKKECQHKYGSQFGPVVFDIFMEIFLVLPVAIVVDETIVCVHSGIPMVKNLNRLYKLPKEASEYDFPIISEIANRMPVITKFRSTRVGGSNESVRHGSLVFGSKNAETNYIQRHQNKSISPGDHNKSTKRSSLAGVKSQLSKMRAIKSTAKIKSSSGLCTSSSLKKSPSISRSSIGGKSDAVQFRKSLSETSKRRFKSQSTDKCIVSPRSVNFRTLKDNKLRISFLKTVKQQHSSSGSGGQHTKKMPAARISSKRGFPQHRQKRAKSQPKVGTASRKQLATSADPVDGFDQNEFEDFLSVNNLSYLVRSNMAMSGSGMSLSALQHGYKMDFENRCLTIVSVCSGGNGGKPNEAAVILIDCSTNTIRFIRFET